MSAFTLDAAPSWTIRTSCFQLAAAVVKTLEQQQQQEAMRQASPIRLSQGPKLGRTPSIGSTQEDPILSASQYSLVGGQTQQQQGQNAAASIVSKFIAFCKSDALTRPIAKGDPLPRVTDRNIPLLVGLLWAGCRCLDVASPAKSPPTSESHEPSGELAHYARKVGENLLPHIGTMGANCAPGVNTFELTHTLVSLVVPLLSYAEPTVAQKLFTTIVSLLPACLEDCTGQCVPAAVLLGISNLQSPIHTPPVAEALMKMANFLKNGGKLHPGALTALSKVGPSNPRHLQNLLAPLNDVHHIQKVLTSTSVDDAKILASALDLAGSLSPSVQFSLISNVFDVLADPAQQQQEEPAAVTATPGRSGSAGTKPLNGEALLIVLRSACNEIERCTVALLNNPPTPQPTPRPVSPQLRPVTPSKSQPTMVTEEPSTEDSPVVISLRMLIRCVLSPSSVTNTIPDDTDATQYGVAVRKIIFACIDNVWNQRGAECWEDLNPGCTLPRPQLAEMSEMWAMQFVTRLREALKSSSAGAAQYIEDVSKLMKLATRCSTNAVVETIVGELGDAIVDHAWVASARNRMLVIELQLDILLVPSAGDGNVEIHNAFCSTVVDQLEHHCRALVTRYVQSCRTGTGTSSTSALPDDVPPPAPGSDNRLSTANVTSSADLVQTVVRRVMQACTHGNPNAIILRELLVKRLIDVCVRLGWPTSSPLQHVADRGLVVTQRIASTVLSPLLGAIATAVQGNNGAPLDNFHALWVLCVWYRFAQVTTPNLSNPPHIEIIEDMSGWEGGIAATLSVIAREAPPLLSFTSSAYVRVVNDVSALERRSVLAGFELKELQTQMTAAVAVVDSVNAGLTAKLSFGECFLLKCAWELEMARGASGRVTPCIRYQRYEMKSFEAPPELRSVVIPNIMMRCVLSFKERLALMVPNKQAELLGTISEIGRAHV